jgi:hypothetical protein
MSKISFRAIPRQFANGSYLLLPATQLDRNCLNQFSANVGSHYLTVTVNYARGNKSYDQVKTIFALINLRFSLQHHRQPTDKEQAMVYSSFLWKYADKVPNPLNPEEEGPVPLSEMDKGQAASFIGSIIADIYEYAGNTLTDTQQVELKEIFEEFQTANFQGIGNPVDYDKDGNLLSEEEWRVKNHFSFASGVASEDMQLHHILSRGSHPQFEHVAWNWIMLTEEEHMRIIHAKGGWQKFIEIFPHCAKRIKNAYDMAHEMYPHEIQTAFIRLGLINEYSEEIKEEFSEAEDLAARALKTAEGNYKGDIF